MIKSSTFAGMNSKKLNINHTMRSIIGVFFIVCILISSCAVKYGIKNVLNVQTTSTSHSSVPKDKFTTSSSVSQCNFCKEKEITAKNASQLSVSDFQELAVFTWTNFAGAFLDFNIQKHPVYSSSRIGIALPLFLQYRQLII